MSIIQHVFRKRSSEARHSPWGTRHSGPLGAERCTDKYKTQPECCRGHQRAWGHRGPGPPDLEQGSRARNGFSAEMTRHRNVESHFGAFLLAALTPARELVPASFSLPQRGRPLTPAPPPPRDRLRFSFNLDPFCENLPDSPGPNESFLPPFESAPWHESPCMRAA